MKTVVVFAAPPRPSPPPARFDARAPARTIPSSPKIGGRGMVAHASGGFSPRQGWRIAVAVGLGCLVVLLGGCQSGGQRDAAPASAVHDPVLQDIPKPAGFKIVDRSSMAKSSGQYRIAQCEYVGSRDRETVRQFYRE